MIRGNRYVIQQLKNLFAIAGIDLKEALNEKCAIAYLHGLADDAYDEWTSAVDMEKIFASTKGYWASEPNDLRELFPHLVFRESEYGWQFLRGRLFSIADYQLAKELIGKLTDDFSIEYSVRFGKSVPFNAHLWD